MEQIFLLYLPTQIRYPIGGKRVKCHVSKLAYSLGGTKLTSSLGKQQLARDQVVHLETAANFCVSRPDVKSRGTFLTGEGIHYSRKAIYNSTTTYQRGKT